MRYRELLKYALAVLCIFSLQSISAQTNQTADSRMAGMARRLKRYQDSLNVASGYPGLSQIAKDLVGHSLSEGVENPYRREDWRWHIEKGEISNLRIAKVHEKAPDRYLFTALMRLSSGYHAYDAKARIKYVRSDKKRWTLDYVVSEGMYIVETHEYDDFIKTEIVDDGWGGVNCLQFTNKSELALAVGGDILVSSGWLRFSVLVPPGETARRGGFLAGGSVEDYRINFIVRDH